MTAFAIDIAVPVEIRAPRSAVELEIVWDTGETSVLPHRLLRAFCPCAHCQGHQGPVRYLDAIDDYSDDLLTLQDLQEVGNYALRLTWADGHSTGIYAYSYLLELGKLAGAEDETQRSHTFSR